MSAKPPPPTLSMRRPSAARAETPTPAPRVEPSVEQQAPPVRPAPRVEQPPMPAAASHVEQPAPARPAPRVALSREAERLTKEPESDFFVSIPQSKKTALKTYCVQRGITMRDWLLAILAEKG